MKCNSHIRKNYHCPAPITSDFSLGPLEYSITCGLVIIWRYQYLIFYYPLKKKKNYLTQFSPEPQQNQSTNTPEVTQKEKLFQKWIMQKDLIWNTPLALALPLPPRPRPRPLGEPSATYKQIELKYNHFRKISRFIRWNYLHHNQTLWTPSPAQQVMEAGTWGKQQFISDKW